MRTGLRSGNVLGIAFEIFLLLAVVLAPPLQDVFHTRALKPIAWLLLLVWPPFVLGAEELRKWLFRRYVWKG